MVIALKFKGCRAFFPSKRFWKRLWKLHVSHKIRHFAWRACRDILPTKSNLVRRGILQNSICESCNSEAENAGHLLWTCSRARELWQSSKMAFLAETNRCASFKDVLWSLLMGDQPREELAAKVVTCAWALWHSRNEVGLGEERKPGNVLLRWALHYLDEYYAAVDFYQTPPAPVTQIPAWIPPSDPSFKVNVDSATFSEMGAVGVGVCVRDDQGRLAAALSKKIPAPLGAIETEAKAVEVGMQFAKDIGLQDFILESDYLMRPPHLLLRWCWVYKL